MKTKKQSSVKRYLAGFDLHYPKVDWPTFRAMLSFMEQNQIDGFIFGGDQLDNQEVSPYTKGLAKLRIEAGTLTENAKGFNDRCLTEIEKRLAKNADKIYIEGNHDDWITQMVNHQPELDGLQTYEYLDLAARGWKHIECGKHWKKGKLTVIHGDTLSGVGNQNPAGPAKKALDAYAANVLFGHFHAPSMATKLLPFDDSEKWQAWVSPILGDTNPAYLRNKPTAWLTGFTVIEFMENGRFNVYLINVFDGEFAFGGKVYRG